MTNDFQTGEVLATDEISATASQYPLIALESGTKHSVTAYHFGEPGARPKAYLQAGLHADEFPGMLVLHYLRPMLEQAQQRGKLTGEIVLLPQANPLGLTQHHQGFLNGRYEAETGSNFNRDFPELAAAVGKKVAKKLGQDAQENIALIRAEMATVLAAKRPKSAIDSLRNTLLTLAHDADLVFDLHADNEALVHMYTGPALWPDASDIAAELDARAILLADLSGGNPFDEACSAPWWQLAERFPDNPIPPACLATTLELGSNDDVDIRQAQDQAAALYRLLERRGVISGPEASALPALRCEATPLAAMSQVKAPQAGLVAYHLRLGDTVKKGDLIATIIDPLKGSTEVLAETDGILFARHSQTYAWPGKIIGKVAGSELLDGREGLLLSD